MQKRRLSLLCMLFCSVLVVSCSTPPVKQAFQGELPPADSNKIINDYCMGCHVHVNFRADPHLAAVHQFYDRFPYQNANECRVCHYVQEEGILLKSVHRGTRWPQWVEKGRFERFEERERARDQNQETP